jgi:hypothetical protein
MVSRLVQLCAFVAVILVASAAFCQKRPKYTAVQYLKNYALSTCVADGFRTGDVFKDAAASARGYMELGDLAMEAHTEATTLGRKFLAQEYKSASGTSLTMMKCIDFYNSVELETLAQRYAPRRDVSHE